MPEHTTFQGDTPPPPSLEDQLNQAVKNNQDALGRIQGLNPAPLYMLAGIEALKTALAGPDRDRRLQIELLHEMIFADKLGEVERAQSGLVVASSVPNLEVVQNA